MPRPPAKRFGLTSSLKKTKVMLQLQPEVSVESTVLNAVDKFCYLGGVLSANAEISDNVTCRTAAASAAFGRLESRLWNKRGIRLSTKVAVYRAVVITTLLYGCPGLPTGAIHAVLTSSIFNARIGSPELTGRIESPTHKC